VGVVLALLVVTGAMAARGGAPAPPGRFTVTFLDVGQGDATLLQAPGGHAALVDGGPPGSGVVEDLRRRGVRSLDVVVLTHAQEDHQGGLEELLDHVPVRVLLDGGSGSADPAHRRITELARRRGTQVIPGAAGQQLRLGRLRLAVLSPPSRPAWEHDDPTEDPNQRALVLLAAYGGLRLFLPADAESEVTGALSLPRVDVLKVAHHGSADEGLAALLQRLRPSASVIEVGSGNRYGHPAPEALRSLAAGGGRVFRTDTDGDVQLVLGSDGPVMSSER
jgi:competence protein ComEC